MRTLISRLAVVCAALGLVVVWSADPAEAHPLGNFSVNQLAALTFTPERVDVRAVVDAAELPTLQEKPAVDRDGADSYGQTSCAAFARGFTVRVAGERVRWTVRSAAFGYEPGSAGLVTSRLTCTLSGPAELTRAAAAEVRNTYRTDRVGWREITAVGRGVGLVDSPLPAKDVSDGLRSYPEDLLSSPLDVRSASFRVRPGVSSTGAEAPAVADGSVFERWAASADAKLQALLGRPELTPTVGVLAVLLALGLGAGHAALPGHGKTVMAAYLAGRRGRRRDALVVGATVTLTHTGGVLVLGLVLTAVAGLVGETVLGYLGVASGILVAAVGTGMLLSARRHRAHRHRDHHHDHGHGHDHTHGPARSSRLALVGMGIAGGLVPSPSALVILLGAIGLGRTAFGVLLVVGYGLGMAGALTAAGLALIVVQERWRWRPFPRLTARWSSAAPLATAGMVLLVGLGLAGRALVTV